jgi:hypothetical protein
MVDANHGGGLVTVINTYTTTNPEEWVLVAKAQYVDNSIKIQGIEEIKCQLNKLYINCETCKDKPCQKK